MSWKIKKTWIFAKLYIFKEHNLAYNDNIGILYAKWARLQTKNGLLWILNYLKKVPLKVKDRKRPVFGNVFKNSTLRLRYFFMYFFRIFWFQCYQFLPPASKTDGGLRTRKIFLFKLSLFLLSRFFFSQKIRSNFSQ